MSQTSIYNTIFYLVLIIVLPTLVPFQRIMCMCILKKTATCVDFFLTINNGKGETDMLIHPK